MSNILPVVSAALAALCVVMLVVLVVRRLHLALIERRRVRLAALLRPVALDVIDGEIDATVKLSRDESRELAVLVARYARRLSGDARVNVAGFFEGRGDVKREIGSLRARRTWKRAAAAFSLGDMASTLAVPPLIAALDDPARDVRSAAARSLGLLRSSDAVPRIIGNLVARTIPTGVAGFALLTIGSAARGELRALLAHDDAAVRAAAADLLGHVGSPGDAPALITLLHDLSSEVRGAAAAALGRVGSDSAAAALRATLDDRIPYVRTAAARSLGALDDIDAVAPLVHLAAHDLFAPAQAAARALTLIDPAEAIAQGRIPGTSPHLLNAAALAELQGAPIDGPRSPAARRSGQ
jgi:HEAT repeat protein